MATILNRKLASYDIYEVYGGSSASAYYTVEASASDRTTTKTTITVKVTSELFGGARIFGGYVLTGQIYLNGSWYSLQLKGSNDYWYSNETHSIQASFQIDTNTTITTLTGVKFKVNNNIDNSIVLLETSCSNIALPNPPLTPAINITGIPNVAQTITINPNNTAYNHEVVLTAGSQSDTITFSAGQTTKTYTIPQRFYSSYPSSPSFQGTVTVKTYSGSTLLGQNVGTLNLGIDVLACNPTMQLDLYDTNQTTTALTGNRNIIIPRWSNGEVSIIGEAKNYAYLTSLILGIDNRAITVDTNNQSSINRTVDLGTINSAKVTGTLTDSRTLSIGTSSTKTLLDYTELALDITFSRPTPTGNKMRYSLNGSWWSGDFGATQNTLTLKWRVKEKNGSTWSNWYDLTYSTSGSGNTKTISASNIEITNPLESGWNYQKAYTFEVRMTDSLNTNRADITKQVPKGKPIYNWYEKNDVNYFNINGNLTLNDVNIFENILFPYTLYENSTGTNGAVTLNDSVSNYEYVDIYFKETWSGYGGFVQRISTSNTYFQLFCNISRSGYNGFMSMAKGYVFNGNTIQKNQYANFAGIYFNYYSMSQPQWLYENDYIYITKVVGYKKVV